MSDRVKIVAMVSTVLVIVATIAVLTVVWPWVLVAVMGTTAGVFIVIVVAGFVMEFTDWRWRK